VTEVLLTNTIDTEAINIQDFWIKLWKINFKPKTQML